MNKNIATTLIIGSILLVTVETRIGSGNKTTKIKGIFKGKYTNPNSGKESYIFLPEYKSEVIFIPTSLISDEMFGRVTNNDSRGNPYASSKWTHSEVSLWVPAWYYRNLYKEGKL